MEYLKVGGVHLDINFVTIKSKDHPSSKSVLRKCLQTMEKKLRNDAYQIPKFYRPGKKNGYKPIFKASTTCLWHMGVHCCGVYNSSHR